MTWSAICSDETRIQLIARACQAAIAHVTSLSKAGSGLGAEYLVVIGLLTAVPLLTLVALKFFEKRRLKAERRAAELRRGQQPKPKNSVAVVQVPPPAPAGGVTLTVDDVSDAEAAATEGMLLNQVIINVLVYHIYFVKADP